MECVLILNKLLCAFAVVVSVNSYAFQQEEVYRWVDEHGNVHYADLPKDAKAKRFMLRQYNRSQPEVTAEELEANNKALDNINKPDEDSASVDNPDNTQRANPCDSIRKQMEVAKTQLNSNDLSKVRQARMYLDNADTLLAQRECN